MCRVAWDPKPVFDSPCPQVCCKPQLPVGLWTSSNSSRVTVVWDARPTASTRLGPGGRPARSCVGAARRSQCETFQPEQTVALVLTRLCNMQPCAQPSAASSATPTPLQSVTATSPFAYTTLDWDDDDYSDDYGLSGTGTESSSTGTSVSSGAWAAAVIVSVVAFVQFCWVFVAFAVLRNRPKPAGRPASLVARPITAVLSAVCVNFFLLPPTKPRCYCAAATTNTTAFHASWHPAETKVKANNYQIGPRCSST
jgi:hypothetical protein